MKKRLIALVLSLVLLSSPALAALTESGQYWTELTWNQAADLVDAARAGEGESFFLVLYSSLCGYSQTYVPQFREYAEANGIRVYGVDQVADGDDFTTRSMDLGFPLSGGYPFVLRYWGDGVNLDTTSDVRSMDAFRAVLEAPPPKRSGDFVINAEGMLLSYTGSQTDVVIPDGVSAIGPNAFEDNTALRSVIVSEGVRSVGTFAFSGCSALERVVLSSTVSELGFFAFSGCFALEEADLSASQITVLPGITFSNLRNLRRVELPASLVTIEKSAFSGCSALREITLPGGLTSIGETAFLGCNGMQTVRFLGSKPDMPTGEQDPFAWAKGAGVYPAGDATWGSAEELKAQHPALNWGGAPGQRLPVPARSEIDDGTLADWALPEVADAVAYELVPQQLQGRYGQPITRQEFCTLIMALVQKQTGQEAQRICWEHEGDALFTDTTNANVWAANMLGLVNGKGEGRFDPEGTITREEAAAMLSRTARYLGVAEAGGGSFTDAGQIAPWAADSVAYLSGLTSPVSGRAVMAGTGGGAFSPKADYSIQEAQCSFLRLYHAAAEAECKSNGGNRQCAATT